MIRAQTTDSDDEEPEVVKPVKVPSYGTVDWLYLWSEKEGILPSPINISISVAHKYTCPELKWYNFDVHPHKIKVTNTGYTVVVGAKWKTERPYLEGGILREKHIFSQMHFHWGAEMREGSDHTVDGVPHPAELQVTFFRKEYMTQEEALHHDDGLMVICYLIRYGVEPDERLARFLEGFPKIQQARTSTKIGPYPMSKLMPLFFEDYFMYWGNVVSASGAKYIVRWVIPRACLYATEDQIKEFRKLWDPWDEPNLRNFRPLHFKGDRHLFLINGHWNLYNSLMPIPRLLEPSISILSSEYRENPWMLPPQDADMVPPPPEDHKKHLDIPMHI